MAGDREGAAAALSDDLIDASAICCRVRSSSTTAWPPTSAPVPTACWRCPSATALGSSRRWPRRPAAPRHERRPAGAAADGHRRAAGSRGPIPVGEYARALRERLREFTRVQVFGEVSGLGVRAKAVYFELRDANGALPCSMWRSDFDRLGVALENGMQVVLAGGCDYYTGSATSSPSFSFRATGLKVAGEGELLAQIERLRRKLHAEGLFEPQGLLPRPALPRSIGVVTGEAGKARDDVLAGLRRRGWAGRLVWGFAPVQDRRAAPRISTGAAGPRGRRRRRRDRGRARRRLGDGPDGLLRRGPLPDGRAAAGAGDRLGGAPHRPHADRRRGGRVLLDAHPRRGDRGAAGLPRGARRGGGCGRSPGRSSAAEPWWSGRGGCRSSRAPPRRALRAPPRPRPTSSCARCVPPGGGGSRRRCR